jgi:hypothetical protein
MAGVKDLHQVLVNSYAFGLMIIMDSNYLLLHAEELYFIGFQRGSNIQILQQGV